MPYVGALRGCPTWVPYVGALRGCPSRPKSGLCYRAAIISRLFFKAQNPLLINESGFKSRAAYDGARTVNLMTLKFGITKVWTKTEQYDAPAFYIFS